MDRIANCSNWAAGHWTMQIAGSRAWPHGSGGPAIALVE